jgi:hypothetical protein
LFTAFREHGATVVIRFTPDREQPAGSIRLNDSPARAFTGWLALIRELKNARGLHAPAPGRRAPRRVRN